VADEEQSAAAPSQPQRQVSTDAALVVPSSASPVVQESIPPQVGTVLEAFKGALDRELTLGERLTGKARQAFVLSIGFFTIVQTVAFNSFHSGFIRGVELTWLFILAIAAISFLALAAFATVRSDVPLKFGEIPLDKLAKLVEQAYEGDVEVPGRADGGLLRDDRVDA
jgi:hypothetical protein